MKLTDRFEDTLTINNIECRLDLSFDNILRIYELKDDVELSDFSKIEFMFEMLVINHEDIDLTLDQKVQTVEFIFSEFITQESVQEKADESEQEEPQQKTYDLNKDADYIYASFFMDYGLDLIEQQGKLHWRKFVALLNGLSEKTPFMQVVRIRTMEVPKANKHNEKERQRIKKLKRLYALDKEEQNADDVFNDMITAFGGRPKGGDDNS